MKQFHSCKIVEKVARGFTGARINRNLFFTWVQCFLSFFISKNLAKFNPQKKKKKVKFILEEQIIKFSQFLCQKDSEISPEKKTTQFYYLA